MSCLYCGGENCSGSGGGPTMCKKHPDNKEEDKVQSSDQRNQALQKFVKRSRPSNPGYHAFDVSVAFKAGWDAAQEERNDES